MFQHHGTHNKTNSRKSKKRTEQNVQKKYTHTCTQNWGSCYEYDGE